MVILYTVSKLLVLQFQSLRAGAHVRECMLTHTAYFSFFSHFFKLKVRQDEN